MVDSSGKNKPTASIKRAEAASLYAENSVLAQGYEAQRTFPGDLYDNVPPDAHTLFPRRPGQVYRENIAAANAGDARAMYWVSKSLYQCSRAPRSPQDLEENILSRAYLEPWWVYFEAMMNQCTDLIALIPGIDPADKAAYWLKQSALAGDKTARAELLLDAVAAPRGETPALMAQAKEAVEAAVKSRDYPAYYQMQRYLERANNQGTETSQAWGYAACKHHPGCDARAALELLQSEYHRYEMDRILEIVSQIESGAIPEDGSE